MLSTKWVVLDPAYPDLETLVPAPAPVGWRAPQRVGFAAPAGKRAHKTWKRRKASGRK